MKKSSFLALALAPMILGAPMAVHAQSVSTDPVGFVKLTLEPGVSQSVGVTLLHPAVAAGLVASSDASTITLDGTHDLAASLDAGTAYYVEVASGDTWEGERFEVDVAGSSGSTLAVSSSAHNTVSLDAADLSGHSIRVRPHRTLSDVFDPTQLTAGGTAGTADNVQFYDGNVFITYWLRAGAFGAPPEWRRQNPDEPANDLVLRPGAGMLVRNRAAEAVELATNIGEVRTNSFRQPLGNGTHLYSEGHPLDNSPSSRVMTEDNGFTAGGNAATADNIRVWNGSSFVDYWYRAGAFGAPAEWRKLNPDEPATDAEIMLADGAVFIKKQGADPFYEAPNNF